jgi:hypothetical protein
MSPEHSPERERFLSDIITGAVEGGIGYWSECAQYQWDDDDGVHVVVGKRVKTVGTTALIHAEDKTGVKRGFWITPDVIQKGIEEIEREIHLTRSDLRETILAASRENEAGDVDADCADVIVQAGLFGELVYG